MNACQVDGCTTKHYARGWCYRHYMQWFRTGKIAWNKRPTLAERFWAKVDKTDGCWEWTGCLFSTGYGQVKLEGKTSLAHRVSWEMEHGELPPDGWVLHHTCSNKTCVRPSHLVPVDRQTHADTHKLTGTAGGRHDVPTDPGKRSSSAA